MLLLVLQGFLDMASQRRNILYWEQLDNKQPLISAEDAKGPNPSVPV